VDQTAFVLHHTAGDGTSLKLLFDSGNGNVPAPLCNYAITRGKAGQGGYPDGTVVWGAAGYTNSEGNNDRDAYNLAISGKLSTDTTYTPKASDSTVSMNRHSVSVEVCATGAMTAAQYKSSVALAAAFTVVFKNSGELQGADTKVGFTTSHKELTRRKMPNDPVEDMGKFRRDVKSFIISKQGVVLPKEHKFRFGCANLQAPVYGGSSDYKGKAKELKSSLNASIYALQESDTKQRDALRSVLPGGAARWKVYVHQGGMIALVWDSSKWRHIKKKDSSKGMLVRLESLSTGKSMDVITLHASPSSVASTTRKKAEIIEATALWDGKLPVILAGDFNLNGAGGVPDAVGWTRVSDLADTFDSKGVQSFDSIYINGKGLVKRDSRIIPAKLSDHHWLLYNGTLS
jgi:hypothetical protein